MRVAIRDTASSKVGSANQFIEVPDIKKDRITLSGIVVENLTEQQWQISQSKVVNPAQSEVSRTNPMADTSLRQFKRGTILRYSTEIYNAKLDGAQKPHLQTQIRVFRDGKMILDGKPKPLDTGAQTNPQKIIFLGALSLGSEMLPGDYVLQIVVIDTLAKEKRKLTTQWIQFEVTG